MDSRVKMAGSCWSKFHILLFLCPGLASPVSLPVPAGCVLLPFRALLHGRLTSPRLGGLAVTARNGSTWIGPVAHVPQLLCISCLNRFRSSSLSGRAAANRWRSVLNPSGNRSSLSGFAFKIADGSIVSVSSSRWFSWKFLPFFFFSRWRHIPAWTGLFFS